MSRDHKKLRVFALADKLAVDVYHATSTFPVQERYGLQAQVRRAVVSAAVNLVEGSARTTTGEYVQFLTVALGSASETRYLVDLSHRLGLLQPETATALERQLHELVCGLQKMVDTLRRQS